MTLHKLDSPRPNPDRPLPTVQTALDNGCQADAQCLDCDHGSRLDLPELAARSCQEVPLAKPTLHSTSICQVISNGMRFDASRLTEYVP
jgi:hypothetical protein